MAIPKDHSSVRPFVRELIERGNITVDEISNELNLYERTAMVPAMNAETLCYWADYLMTHCCYPGVQPNPTGQTAVDVVVPELIRRLKEAEATIARMKEDEHGRRMEAREEYDT